VYIVVIFIPQLLAGNIEGISTQLKGRYVATRFCAEENVWPPEPPKEYVPLALIRHNIQKTENQIVTLEKAKGAGKIAKIIAAANEPNSSAEPNGPTESNDNNLTACLQGCASTHNISDILAPLEDPSNARLRTVLIEGAPGLGKTVLLRNIAYKWAQGEVLLQSHFVFLLTLRDPDVRKMASLTDLVKYFCTESDEKLKTYTNLISKTQGKNVTFLLDGYDELPSQARQKSFIAKIIQRQNLSLSAVVISSRPHASANLRNISACQVDILGFTREDQQHFFKTSLGEQSKKLNELTEYLDSHPTIRSLCFIPFHATILVWLCKQGRLLPDSSTALYNNFIFHTILHHLKREDVNTESINDLYNLPPPYHKILEKLSELCFKALRENDLVFSFKDIKSACPTIEKVPGALNAFGLLQVVEHYGHDQHLLGKPTKTFNFIHFSVQEFLAAYHVTCLKDGDEFKCLNANFFAENYGNMFAMYVGLTSGQHAAFKKFLSSYGRGILARIFRGKKDQIASQFFEDDRKCLKLFQCFYEANDEQSYNNIIKKLLSTQTVNLQKDTTNAMSLFMSDMHCLTFFLARSQLKSWSTFNLPLCHIGDDGLRMLHQCLATNSITVDFINLQDNSLKSQSANVVAAIVLSCETKRLSVKNNALENGLDLSKCSTLLELDISHNFLSPRGASRLFSILSNSQLRVLKINHNPLSEEAVDGLAKYLKENTTLQELYAKKNKLATDSAIKIFSTLRDAKNTNLKVLDLSDNFIKDEAVDEIVASLQCDFLITLYLQGNDINTPSIEKLVDSLANNQNLTKLGVSSNEELPIIKTKKEEINKKRNYQPKLEIYTL